MSKNYFVPHEIVAKIFRAQSKIVRNFLYPTHIRSAWVPAIKNGRSLNQKLRPLALRRNYGNPPKPKILSISVNANEMIYGIYGKLETPLIIKNYKQIFTGIIYNTCCVSTVST